MKTLPQLPEQNAQIVAMIEHQGTIYVASHFRIYRLVDGVFHPVAFVVGDEGMMIEPSRKDD